MMDEWFLVIARDSYMALSGCGDSPTNLISGEARPDLDAGPCSESLSRLLSDKMVNYISTHVQAGTRTVLLLP